jgi:hypothetical protein
MSTPDRTNSAGSDRLLDLMCDHATCGLSDADRAEFEALCAQFPELNDGSIERAAAAADLAFAGAESRVPMPAQLKARIQAQGERMVVSGAPVRSGERAAPMRIPSTRRDPMRALGWLAAAAAVVLAAIGWLRPPNQGGGPNVDPPVSNRSPSEVRQQLLASAPDAVVIPMGDWDSPEQPGVKGDVVWSEAEQTGYIRLVGLKENDPAVEQYQLWIVDSRGMGQRISGALFDAKPDPVTGEVIVRIEPEIATQGAAAFALTIEKPGGVWVSDMTRRVVIGAKG